MTDEEIVKEEFVLTEEGEEILKKCETLKKKIEPIIKNSDYYNRIYQISAHSIK